MKKILINNVTLPVKDYYCCSCDSNYDPLAGEAYYPRENPRLWLYVNVTDRCNAACPFCVNKKRNTVESIDLERYRDALKIAAPYVSGVSFTGGEPMLDPNLLDTMIGIADSIIDSNTEFDMVTNGTNLELLPGLTNLSRFSTIHISRHSIDDEENRSLMRWSGAPGWDTIKRTVAGLADPGAVVLNCVLQKNGVHDMDGVCAYLDKAIEAGICNTSFITMMQANAFCIDNYISPDEFAVITDEQVKAFNSSHDSKISIWNRTRDHDFCRCLSGSYETAAGRTRFYFRCPGTDMRAEYCRQLVYTSDNKLQAGWDDTGLLIMP